MKNVNYKLALLLSLIFAQLGLGQEEGDVINLKADAPVISVIINTSETGNSKNVKFLESNFKYKVIHLSDSSAKLKALNFKPISIKKQQKFKKKYGEKPRDLKELYNNKIYTISREDYNQLSLKSVERDRLSIGIVTLPFKARPQSNFSFDTEFNFNSTLNCSLIYFDKISMNFQLGAGIGTVGLNSNNALGLGSDDLAQDVSTITFLTGLMLEYNKVQAGLYVGTDNINNQKHYQWTSNGNLWFGFGIGYDIFNLSLAKISQNRN